MPDEFDSNAAAQDLARVVSQTSQDARQQLPPATPAPLFHKLQDGSVTDSSGHVILPAPTQTPAQK